MITQRTSARLPTRLRFPRWGTLPYELLDNAAFLLVLATIGYLLSDPPATNRDALALVYHVLPAWAWGTGLTLAATGSILCACVEPWVRRGMVLLMTVCVFWASCFAVGALLYAVIYAPTIVWAGSGVACLVIFTGLVVSGRRRARAAALIALALAGFTTFTWAGFYEPSIIRVAISITLYFWIASRLSRDLARWDTELAARKAFAA